MYTEIRALVTQWTGLETWVPHNRDAIEVGISAGQEQEAATLLVLSGMEIRTSISFDALRLIVQTRLSRLSSELLLALARMDARPKPQYVSYADGEYTQLRREDDQANVSEKSGDGSLGDSGGDDTAEECGGVPHRGEIPDWF